MTASTNVISLLRDIPRHIAFTARLEWLEHRETQTREDVMRHSDDVAKVSAALARVVGFDDEFVSALKDAARWHDIGKLATPDAILNKAGKLTNAEKIVMDRHASDGAMLLGDDAPQIWKDVVRFHHERYDGYGYNGLKGERIPMSARLVAIADVFDALTAERSYKRGMSVETALSLMAANVESPGFGRRAFDPVFLRAFVADYLTKPDVTFSPDCRKTLQDFALSNPMDDFNGDKYANEGWLLKPDGKRLKYQLAESGNDRLQAIYSQTGELLFDASRPEENNRCKFG